MCRIHGGGDSPPPCGTPRVGRLGGPNKIAAWAPNLARKLLFASQSPIKGTIISGMSYFPSVLPVWAETRYRKHPRSRVRPRLRLSQHASSVPPTHPGVPAGFPCYDPHDTHIFLPSVFLLTSVASWEPEPAEGASSGDPAGRSGVRFHLAVGLSLFCLSALGRDGSTS